MQQSIFPRLRLAAVLAALWLSACGGGGDDSGVTADEAAAVDATMSAAPLRAPAAPAWSVAYPTPQIWHSLSSSAAGDVLAAGTAGSAIHVSADGGATWTAGDSPSGIWISSAMSATGDRIFAVQYGVGMYTSTDHGRTWTQVTSSPLVYDPNGINFEAVSMSQDGRHIAAVIQNGRIVLSNDAGVSWQAATLPDAPQERWWRWLDSSADGRTIVAVSHNGEIYLSQDTGVTWKAVTVAVGSPATAMAEHWYRVKLSADGRTIAVVANSFGGGPGTGIYVSHDRGRSWTRGFSLVADYTFLAMSGDGKTMGATMSNTDSTPGRVLLSTDGGASFAAQAMPGTDTNWRAMAMSVAGDRMAVVAGGFNTQSAGLLYTSGSARARPRRR